MELSEFNKIISKAATILIKNGQDKTQMRRGVCYAIATTFWDFYGYFRFYNSTDERYLEDYIENYFTKIMEPPEELEMNTNYFFDGDLSYRNTELRLTALYCWAEMVRQYKIYEQL